MTELKGKNILILRIFKNFCQPTCRTLSSRTIQYTIQSLAKELQFLLVLFDLTYY